VRPQYGASYAKQSSGKYSHRIFKGSGHNVPQEARSLASDARARFRIMDSNEARGTVISLRISAFRSKR